MRSDAEIDGTPRWATRNDDRVTRLGRIIRKLRIDNCRSSSMCFAAT
jgi:lipopolysaccharide/colanic/teichoic acid biosynthesis glycosyltransferase